MRAAVSAISTLSGWASMVRSIEVPPVDMLPVRASLTRVPAGRTSSIAKPWSRDERLGRRVDRDPGQHLLVADAATRIAVGDVDQLADRVLAVAGHRRGDALGDGRDLAADDQAAIVVARDVALDHDVARPALGQRAVERGADGLLRAQVEVDAPAVVAVERLDHARVAEPLGHRHRAVLGVDDVRPRDRQPGRVEQPVGEALVRRDVDADGRGQRGHRRPDPLLVDAVAELDERVAVEPDERDVAADRLVDERLRRRPERLPLGEPDEPLHLRREVEQKARDRPARRGG